MSDLTFKYSYIQNPSDIVIVYSTSAAQANILDTKNPDPVTNPQAVEYIRKVVNKWKDASFSAVFKPPLKVLEYVDKVSDFLQSISDILEGIKQIASAIVAILNALSDFQQSMLAILKKLAEMILNEIKALIESIRSAGIYMCEIKVEVTGTSIGTDGGFETFSKRVGNALSSTSVVNSAKNSHYPRYGEKDLVGGLVVMYGAGYETGDKEALVKSFNEAWDMIAELFHFGSAKVDSPTLPMKSFSGKPEIIYKYGLDDYKVIVGGSGENAKNNRGVLLEWSRNPAHSTNSRYFIDRKIVEVVGGTLKNGEILGVWLNIHKFETSTAINSSIAHTSFEDDYDAPTGMTRVFDDSSSGSSIVRVSYRMVTITKISYSKLYKHLYKNGGTIDIIYFSKDLREVWQDLASEKRYTRVVVSFDSLNLKLVSVAYGTKGPMGSWEDPGMDLYVHNLDSPDVIDMASEGRELMWCVPEAIDDKLLYTAEQLDAQTAEALSPGQTSGSTSASFLDNRMLSVGVPVVTIDGKPVPIDAYNEPWKRYSVADLTGNTLGSIFNIIATSVNNIMAFANGIPKFSKYDLVVDQLSVAKANIDALLAFYEALKNVLRVEFDGTIATLYLPPQEGGTDGFAKRVKEAAMSDSLKRVINSSACKKCSIFGGVIFLSGIRGVPNPMTSVSSVISASKDAYNSASNSVDNVVGKFDSLGESSKDLYSKVLKSGVEAIKIYNSIPVLDNYDAEATISDLDSYFGKKYSLVEDVVGGVGLGIAEAISLSDWSSWREQSRGLSGEKMYQTSSALLGSGSSSISGGSPSDLKSNQNLLGKGSSVDNVNSGGLYGSSVPAAGAVNTAVGPLTETQIQEISETEMMFGFIASLLGVK